MKNLFLILVVIFLAACSKDPIEQRMVQLSVEGTGIYSVTYGTANTVTIEGEDKWSATFWANPHDTVQLCVKTSETPATLYLGIEMEEGLLFCKSLYIESQSVGMINCVVKP